MQRLASILGVIIGISVVGYIVLSKLQHGGIWGLLGFETMTSMHTFVVNSPDGRTRSQVREHMDGNDAVVVDIERLNDHKKTTQRMSVDDWNKLYARVKNNIEPGTDKVEYFRRWYPAFRHDAEGLAA
jgi:hypothetical protein